MRLALKHHAADDVSKQSCSKAHRIGVRRHHRAFSQHRVTHAGDGDHGRVEVGDNSVPSITKSRAEHVVRPHDRGEEEPCTNQEIDQIQHIRNLAGDGSQHQTDGPAGERYQQQPQGEHQQTDAYRQVVHKEKRDQRSERYQGKNGVG